MKPYLLTMGYHYDSGDDWIGAFRTYDEALANVVTTEIKHGEKRYHALDQFNARYETFNIINLEDWGVFDE